MNPEMPDTQSAEIACLRSLVEQMGRRLSRLHRELVRRSPNPSDNIQHLTGLCGELLEADFALYNRLEGGRLRALGLWRCPQGFSPDATPEGRICFDVIQGGSEEAVVINELQASRYAETDPTVRQHGVQTYLGKAIKCGGAFLSSLCVLYKAPRQPSEEDKHILEILAAAISSEEERRGDLEALLISEQRYRTFVEKQSEPICRWVPGTVLTFTNASYNQIFNTRGESLIGRRWIDLVPAEQQEACRRYHADLEANPRVLSNEQQVRHADGSLHHYQWTDIPLFNVQGACVEFQTIGRDITNFKRIEEALRESEERYRRITLAVTDYMYTVHIENGRPAATTHSEACMAVTGYVSREFAGDSYLWIKMVHEEDREIVRRHAEQALAGTSMAPLEHRIRRKDGQLRWVQNTIVPHFDQQGRLICYDGLVRDITERKVAEETLKKSEHELQLTLEATTDGIWKRNLVTHEIIFSPRFYTMLGYSVQEFPATLEAWRNLIHPEDLHQAKIVSETYFTASPEATEHVYRLRTKSGEYRWIHVLARVVDRDRQGNPVRIIGNHQDVTERKKAEEGLRTTQRLESLGILAGGIAHDFNNLLNGVFGYVDMARDFVQGNEQAGKLLNKALNAYERAKDLSGRLLTFARGGEPVKRRAAVGELFKGAISLMLAGSNIKRQVNIAAELWESEADTGQISGVFNNLILNARQAMPDGGLLALSAENVVVQKKEGQPSRQGPFVRFTIKDSGVGIAKENLSKIFDPFFSTKEAGSGLGLAVAYSIINKHSGFIEVESEPGNGAEFRVFLPAARPQPAGAGGEGQTVPDGQGRILVMDDEQFILDYVGTTLSKAGYTIEIASDGEQAIAKFKQALPQQPFDAVILDLTIPGGMGGKLVVQELLKLCPGVKAIASSGYSDDPVMAFPQQFGFKATLFKPYRKEELGDVVRQVLFGIG
jgi:PAS domain S-box-containing protein